MVKNIFERYIKYLRHIKELPARMRPAVERLQAVSTLLRRYGATVAERLQTVASLLRRYGPPVAGLMLAAAVVAGVIWLRPRFGERYDDYHTKRETRPIELLNQAEALAASGRAPEAFTLLRRAIDQAVSSADRAAAGAAMGKLLLDYARHHPSPYAQMARGYLEAALTLEPFDDRKVNIYHALLEAAVLQDDYPAILRFCNEGLELARAEDDRAVFMLARLDALLRVGTWDAVNRAWEDSRPYRQLPLFRTQLELREAFIMEGILTNPDWYADLIAQSNGRRDPVSLRQEFFRKALGIYDRLGEMDPSLADECLFRSARLCAAENNFDAARRRIRRYFENEYPRHNEDIMLLLTRMMRLDGNKPETAELISICLERFDWEKRSAPQVLELVAAAEAVGHDPEALFYLEQFLRAQAQPQENPRLLLKAGQLAARLQRYADALDYFKQTLEAGPDDEMYVTTLLSMADVNMRLGRMDDTQNALVLALTRFPYDPRRGRVLYQLVDLYSRSDASLADILLVTSLAVNVAPNDPESVAVLMQLARIYEELGLYAEAQDRYAKVALLRTIKPGRPADGRTEIPVSEALLGSARCLMRMNDIERADRVLRELCQINRVDPIHSVAAYLWATIAMDQQQYQEARRRLALIDLFHCPPDVRARAQLDGMLIDIALERRAPESVVDFLKNIAILDRTEREEYIRRAYTMAFDRVIRQETPERIQWFIDRAADKTDVLPLANWVMRLASRILREEGVPEFIACLDRNRENIRSGHADAEDDLNALMALAVSLENTKERVWEQLQ